jgi:two-component system NtrC family sensor kinase
VIRGFALFNSVTETIFLNTLITMLFVLTLWLQKRSFAFLVDPRVAVTLVLIWFVILMAWFVQVVINRQKIDLIRAQAQLMRADTLARVGVLASGVSHEINNPLGIIIATTEYLKKSTPPEDPRYEEIESIVRESHRCKEIVEQLLTFANPKTSEVTFVNLAELNDEVLRFIFPRGRTQDIEIVKEYDAKPLSIRADPNLIKQALLNLYINAKQAIPKGEQGRIIARVYRQKRPPEIAIEIEDNGSGIKADDMYHVFDPFFTRKPKGTGLGLSVTQRIVESFGGSISIDSVRPHGTLLKLQFPEAVV